MPLQVWLPLNGDLYNNGLDTVDISLTNCSFSSDGKIGKCLKLGYTNNFTIPAMTGAKQISIAYWCRVDVATSSQWLDPIHYYTTDGTETPYVTRQEFYSNCTATGFWYKGGSFYGYNLAVGDWHHYVITMDYQSGVGRFYMDGELKKTNTDLDTTHYITGLNFRLGESGLDLSENDVRIYDHIISPKEVKLLSQGLVAHYQLNGDGRGLPNLANNTNTTLTNKFGYSEQTGGSTNSIVLDDGIPCIKITRNSTEHSGWDYLHYDDLRVSEIKTSTTYTVSMDIKCSRSGSVGFNGFLNGNATNSMNQAITIVQGDFSANTWSHIVLQTLTKSSFDEITVGSQCVYMTCQFLRATGSWLMMKNMHVQEGSVDTKWAPSMSDTAYTSLGYSETTVYDSSGFNYHGKINTAMTISSDSARSNISTVFNGTDNAIQIPFNTMLGLTTAEKRDYTISVWTYKENAGNKAHQTIIGGPSGFELEARNGSGADPLYRIYNWGGTTTSYEFGKWQHFCFVHTSSDSKLYVNGELRLTGSSVNIPIGNFFIGSWRDVTSQNYEGKMSDFRIYATALSADDIKALYNAPVSVANNGTMITQGEFVEV